MPAAVMLIESHIPILPGPRWRHLYIDRSHKEAGILTDAEWESVRALLPEQKPGQGRPRRDDRQVLCGILWVMDTGASWRELPEEEFGPNSTAHGRYRKWLKEGLWSQIVEALGR
jgi:transposase